MEKSFHYAIKFQIFDKQVFQWLNDLMLKKAILLTSQAIVPLFKSSFGLLIPIGIISEGMKYYFSLAPQLAPRDSSLQMLSQIGDFTVSLTASFLLILLIPIRLDDWYHKRPFQKWLGIVQPNGWPLFVEGFRMTGQILLWSLLLIIPGIYKQIQYLFVPFVVLFDSEYKSGKVDALNKSAQLSKGIFWNLGFIFLLSFGSEILFEMDLKLFPFLPPTIEKVLFQTLGFLSSIVFYSIFYFLYALQKGESSHHVPQTDV